MALTDHIATDFAATVLNTDEFATAVTYTPTGGSGTSISALVSQDAPNQEPYVRGDGFAICEITVAVADVARDVFVADSGVADHAERVAMVPFAGPRTADWQRFSREIALLLLFLNPSVDVESTDAELKTAIAGLWTVYAQILVAKGLIEVAV